MKLRGCPNCYEKEKGSYRTPEYSGMQYACPRCGMAAPWVRHIEDRSSEEKQKLAANLWNEQVSNIMYGEDSFGPDEEEDYEN